MDAKITPNMFFDQDVKQVYQFALDQQEKHGAFPSEAFTKSNFPNFPRVKITDPIEMLLDAFKQWRQAQVIKTTILTATQKYSDGDFTGALAEMEQGVDLVAAESVSDSGDIDLTKNPQDRYQEYLDFASRPPGLLGVPTGYPTIDDVISGLQPEQLIVVVALPKVGKSTLALKIGIAAHEAGEAVMFQTIEMSAKETLQRHDAMRAKVSFSNFRTGNLRTSEKRKYNQMLDDMAALPERFVITDNVTNIHQIAAKIEEIKPKVVIVDGVYLLESHPDFAPGSPQALTYLTRAFKKLAQRTKTTVIITTQALQQKLQGGRLSAHSIGYSASFLQDADLVLGLEMNEANDEDARQLSLLASRNTGRTEVSLTWDWENGDFDEVGSVTP